MRNKKGQEDKHSLKLWGAKENNLQNVSLTVPHDRLVAITGVSGSGKSTLAFDTIYAEGGRRYIETFSPYTRQFLDRLHRPDVDLVDGVRPALALEQRNKITSARSTVGTVTEINDYLKIIWAHLATLYCPGCGAQVLRDAPHEVARRAVDLAAHHQSSLAAVAFPVSLSASASRESLIQTLEAEGFLRFYDPEEQTIQPLEKLPADERREILIVVDRLKLDHCGKEMRERIRSSVTHAYVFGHQKARLLFNDPSSIDRLPHVYPCTDTFHCAACDRSFARPRPSLFTFNSPLGACPSCHGFGKVLAIDVNLCVPNPNKSIREGAVGCWSTPATRRELNKLKAFCAQEGIDVDCPWQKLSSKERKLLFDGPGRKSGFKGIKKWFEKLERKRHKVHVRVFLSRYRREFGCPECGGSRLRPEASWFRINDLTISDVWKLPVDDLLMFFRPLLEGASAGQQHLLTALQEVVSRIEYMSQIGLGYLTLDRQSRTLSGGESQRVNLTSILGARLVHTTLVLDEPTIGLHARDTARLISTFNQLRDRGNSIIVVEHDPDVIEAVEEVIDLGPGAGEQGGEVVYQGPPAGLRQAERSLTGRYLSQELQKRKEAPLNGGFLAIKEARANNLKNIDVQIPLGGLIVLTGVSGSGKSTLTDNCLFEPYTRWKNGATWSKGKKNSDEQAVASIKGLELVHELVRIDQNPVGKTPRANPATYSKAWESIRECLAGTEAAQQLALTKSSFSFNVDGGRCPVCKGAGQIRIEMQFLADVFVECEACQGARFQDKVLSIRFGGKTVLDFLRMTLTEAAQFLQQSEESDKALKAAKALAPLLELGLGYLRLGQPLSSLSGGEAQRLKLASYLSESTSANRFFILDEPTTGLHPYNIEALLKTFQKLIEQGNTVLCIEHNLDVISHADWIIDLGPEGGDQGGEVVAEGTLAHFLDSKALAKKSHTARLLQERQARRGAAAASKAPVPLPLRPKSIQVHGAREHNLKNLNVDIPHEELTVITGVSGSGKSTLAFDIIFAEGQRRYIDCLSPYARQYIKQLQRADVDKVAAIPPTIAVSQKTAPPLGVSTVATVIELYQYLRLLYSKVGQQLCPEDGVSITSASMESIVAEIANNYKNKRIYLYAPVVSGRKGYYNDLFQRALKAEITQAKIDGELVSLHSELRLARHKLHWISLSVASISRPTLDNPLLAEAVSQCLLLGNGTVEVYAGTATGEPDIFSISRVCPSCGRGYRELDPQDFSFRSMRGVCKRCQGWGRIAAGRSEKRTELCPACHGSRIGAIGSNVLIQGKKINELTSLTPLQLLAFIERLNFPVRLLPVVEPIVHELKSRLKIMADVGLDYIALDRDAFSLSGGEAQRLRLCRALGSPLTGVCYVLDEPSIGLHPCDQSQLMSTLQSLRDAGNTVIVVEHDEETIRQADLIIDVGPKGGAEGGQIVAKGTVEEIEANSQSLTGQALVARKTRCSRVEPADGKSFDFIRIEGASANNLKDIEARFPLNAFTVVCGVSGAGKSSLVHHSLVPAVIEEFEGETKRAENYERTWRGISNLGDLNRLLEIDQSPVGKSSASCPASFMKIFDEIRKTYALLPEAQVRGWAANHFSFNTGAGRCPECDGKGFIKVPMSFLPDAVTTCETCGGQRYNDETLELLFQGISIGELLKKTCAEAHQLFANHKGVRRPLQYMVDLGLGYLTLGQPTHTLSGGEVQRLKIARELGQREAQNTLYILDEPTVGLHMTDVDKLTSVIQSLVRKGNTVVVIEHDLNLIECADYVIELGPGPGERGGKIIFSGTVEELLHSRTPTRAALARLRGKAGTGRSRKSM